ncbi:MAG: zinc dependent phospholipase C family protein, partial [Lachnospira sp.]|nr:zinc dependent phospholipase C family protein [Lachnospira sp.]
LTKHNIEETFDLVCEFISKLTVDSSDYKKISTSYCRKLGEVTHYLADYFTFPHNTVFTGSFMEHCEYEKQLKYALRTYIQSGEVSVNSSIVNRFTTPAELCDYVLQIHKQYLCCNKTVESDCRYIVALCHVVVAGILNLLEMNRDLATAC